MLTTVEGVFRDGKIELTEIPMDVDDDTPVIVTFLTAPYVDLQTRGIGRKQALALRDSLASFAEDWDRPEMEIYDRYDDVKSSG